MKIVFDKFPQVFAGVSERSDKSMVWWNRLPVENEIKLNRDSYFQKLGINPGRVIAGGIAHGVNVAVVDEKDSGKYLLNTDALISNAPNLFLSVTVADCMPVFFFDSRTLSFGIAHAGWRGLVDGILENTVQGLCENFNSNPGDISVIIGPHIQACCFEVGEEVAEKFHSKNIINKNNQQFANLSAEAEMRLRKSGVKDITVSSLCTFDEKEKFFSARRDKVQPLQGMVAFLGIELGE